MITAEDRKFFSEIHGKNMDVNIKLFSELIERIGCEGEQANASMEFWLSTYENCLTISRVPEHTMPLLYAFYAGYAYCKERYKLDE